MTNQANEDELRAVVSDMLASLMVKSSLQKLDKRTDLITSGRKYIAMHNEELSTILALIRTEKLKLLDEVIHQSTVNLKSAKAVAGWAELRKKQLEAEL